MGMSTVAVIGAGAAGVLTSVRLLELGERRGQRLEVVLVDPAEDAGRGVAYSTDDPSHLLNVPAGKLSADLADPGHFAHWAGERLGRPVGAGEFLPRHLLGAYLGELLDTTAARCRTARLRRVRERATGVRNHAGGITLRLAGGDTLTADAAVLAVGVTAPGTGWAPAALRESARFVANPWAPDAGYDDGDILCVGSGLTMVDVALQLDRPHRTVHVVSRTGLLPRRHLRAPKVAQLEVEPAGADGLDALWRTLSTGRAWRTAVDSLRPHTARIWGELPESERERFLTEKSRYWNAYRHRMAPAAADRLREMRRAGRLRLHTGEVAAATPDGDGVRVDLSCGDAVRVGTVVNCTGPSLDLRATPCPLVAGLLADGLATPGPHGLGLDTDADGRLRGRTNSPLWTIGAMRVGTLWESTAFPEIRAQASTVASSVLSAASGPRKQRDRYGLTLSTNPAAAESFTEGVDRVLRGQHGALEHLTAATEADPDFALGHAVLGLLGMECGASVDVAARLRDAQACAQYGDERERSFVAAVADLPHGGAALLRHIETYPRDALAVNVAVPTIAFGGLTTDEETWALVERLAGDYGDDWWYLSQLAFVRQEQGRYDEAETLSARALAAEPASGHAVHARTHVFYETGEHHAGLDWLNGWITERGTASDGRVHFTWHAALHELMLGDDAAVRRRYDRDLAPPAVAGPRALVDSASLLWRCEMTSNWDGRVSAQAVLDVSPVDWLATPATTFAAMHAAIALTAARHEDGLRALQRYAAGHDSPVYRQVVAPLCEGLANVVAGRWDAAVTHLESVRPHVCRLGGSAAQREVIEDTFVHALASAGRHADAAEILTARLDRRPPSPLERGRLAGLRSR
ncbi:MAG TPA: FAD/NAD(P)-binding protein [Actinophytocola sp.]|jgi:uncharacterized NAD(P)/FAD-binding protein YdhS|nr:FAD/NAD(P)-binding protein [Actinophytocola sp.]